jgi:hypothetical protein
VETKLAWALFILGFMQLSVLVASALVPLRLEWKTKLQALPKLHRQMVWVYGGYTVLSIVSLALVCLICSAELAAGSRLARAVCGFGAVFWGLRLLLQLVLDVKPHLATWWLRAGYHLLTVWFTCFTLVYLIAAFAAR